MIIWLEFCYYILGTHLVYTELAFNVQSRVRNCNILYCAAGHYLDSELMLCCNLLLSLILNLKYFVITSMLIHPPLVRLLIRGKSEIHIYGVNALMLDELSCLSRIC